MYTKQTWASGDTITATKLNNIEGGVQSVNNSYTPTTWVNGDIITATKLNNIEQGIANAGGGSSDFSTATMTISGFPSGLGGGVDIGWFVEIKDGEIMPVGEMSAYQNGTYVVVLYQGTGYVSCYSSITVSGDAEYDGEEVITVTGDFTISPLS